MPLPSGVVCGLGCRVTGPISASLPAKISSLAASSNLTYFLGFEGDFLGLVGEVGE